MKRGEFCGEFLGAFILVLFGTGSVAVSILFNAHQSLLQIGLIWGIGVTLAIYMARHLSCAHLNPAVTIAMAVSGRMRVKKVPLYLLAQFSGAFFAAFIIYLLFFTTIADYESANNITRGSFESVATAKMFGEYYKQPGGTQTVGMPLAMGVEFLGTFLLVLAIFLLTESCNVGKPDDSLCPLFIGLAVTSVICLTAPLTQAGLNPARDFAPRIVSWIFGWGKWAFPDNKGGFFWVYILSPIFGAVSAGLLFTKIIEPLMKVKKAPCCQK